MADRKEESLASNEFDKRKESNRGMKRKARMELRKQNKKTTRKEIKKKPGFAKELYEETTSYIKNGLRHVYPYFFTFTTYCKGRWVGRTLINVFKEEFRLETQEYYEKAIKAGKITVNGSQVPLDTVLKDNDVICNKVHRHEPPVVGKPLDIVELNEELVVLNKPSSIPVHPCGRYRHNTVVFLLGKEHGLTNLYTIHRIDRLTSGILMFARTLSKAQEIESQVRNRQIEKQYLCRVQGEFPQTSVDCKEPILVVSHKIGVCRVSADGKPCRTVFTRLSYNGCSSVLKCVPYTGRMHQIRVHLQWLGYPIINDPIYNHEAWGPEKGRAGVSDDLAEHVICELAKSSAFIGNENIAESQETRDQCTRDVVGHTVELTESNLEEGSCCKQEEKDQTSGSGHNNGNGCHNNFIRDGISDELMNRQYYDEECSECQIRRKNPTRAELTMYLHALSYKGPSWEFRTELPSWAREDWSESLVSS